MISPMRIRTRESSISWLYPTTRDVNRFSSMSVSILLLLGFAEKSRSGLSSKQGIGHRRFSALLPPLTTRACVRLDVPRHVLCTPTLVSPPTPSRRFVSAYFRAETGRRRGPCQLKTSRQASQQLR